MQKSSAVILPKFSEVISLEKYKFTSDEAMCECVCKYEESNKAVSRRIRYSKKFKIAWLINENYSLGEFINTLGKKNGDTLDLYDFYAAYNIKFPPETVTLIDRNRLYDIRDMLQLLSAILYDVSYDTRKNRSYVILLTPGRLSHEDIEKLRVQILQQFVYLRIYIPVNISAPKDMKQKYNQRLSIFGTKKSGKSTLINALLGDEYSPSSSEVPTPCVITYTEDKIAGRNIFIEHEGTMKFFSTPEDIHNFLSEKFREAAKSYDISVNEINITLPVFPDVLRGFTVIDTPGPNFKGAKTHRDITYSEIEKSDLYLFVMNYSTYLTDDEIKLFDAVYRTRSRTIIIALNKIDDMYSSEVTKSYERVADYIKSRLNALGYDDFIVVPVSALISLYAQKIGTLIEHERGQRNSSLIRNINQLKQKYKNTDKLTMLSFIENIVQTKKDFHGLEIKTPASLEETGRIEYLLDILPNA